MKLTEKHKANRLLFSKKLQLRLWKKVRLGSTTSLLELKDIIWTDEKLFTVQKAEDNSFVYVDSVLRWRDVAGAVLVNEKPNKSYGSVMVACGGGLNADGSAGLVFPRHFLGKGVKMQASNYQDLVDHYYAPYMQLHGKTVFWQDDAPSHTAKSTMAHLKTTFKETVHQPSLSPDLNVLDYCVWSIWANASAAKNRRISQSSGQQSSVLMRSLISQPLATQSNMAFPRG